LHKRIGAGIVSRFAMFAKLLKYRLTFTATGIVTCAFWR
jgi:hypothetical protein